MKTRVIACTVVGLIGTMIIVSSIPVFGQELYFDPDFEFLSDDRFERERRYLIGDTVTISGHSGYYDEKTEDHIPAPNSVFLLKITNSFGQVILDEERTSDQNGDVKISFSLDERFKIGEYKAEMTVKNKNDEQYLDRTFFVGPHTSMIVKTNSAIDLHITDSSAVIHTPINFAGTLCGNPMAPSGNDQTGYLLPYLGLILEKHSVQILAEFTGPDGNKMNSTSHFDKDYCTEFSFSPKAGTAGEWYANVTAWWIEGDTMYEASSGMIHFTVKEPIYYSEVIEVLDLSLPQDVGLQDWHSDGNLILLDQYEEDLLVLDLNTLEIRTLDVPFSPDDRIYKAKFSHNHDFLYVTNDEALWRFFPDSGKLEKVMDDVEDFDVLDDERLMFTKLDGFIWGTSFGLYILNHDGTEQKRIHSDNDLEKFDASDDGTKVVFRNTVDSGLYWKERQLEVLDVMSGTTFVVPNVKQSCGHTPQLTPAKDIIIHHTSSCSRGWPGGVVYASTLDGTYTETIIPASNNNPQFLISPDGQYILTTSFGEYGNIGYLYKITLSKPIPEFGSVVAFILVVSVLSVLTYGRFSRLKAW